MMNFMRKFWNDEEGQGLTEYALIIALVAVLIVGALIAFRHQIEDVFERIGDALGNDGTGGTVGTGGEGGAG